MLASLGNAADAQRSALTAGFGAALMGSVGLAIAGVSVALWVIQEADCRNNKLGRNAEVERSR